MCPPEVKEPRSRRSKTADEALAALMRLCARAEKCESDARRLMRGWGVAAADAERVLGRLVGDRFIDDGRYAAAFVREKVRLSGWGPYKIRAALQRKGIGRELIDAALAAAGGGRSDARERLVRQLERKRRLLSRSEGCDLKNKLIRYGISLGYDCETVLETVASLAADLSPCDEF